MTLGLKVGFVCTVIVRRQSEETCGIEMAKFPTTCADRSVRLLRLHRLVILSLTFFDLFVVRGRMRNFGLF